MELLLMRTIHFIGGEKGGVGKSVMSRVLTQYFIDNSIPVIGFDTDKSHGALLRFYSDFTSPITIDNYESLDNLVETLSENPDTHVVVDLAAQNFAPLSVWINDSGLFDILQELNTSMFFWHVMDDGMDSLNLLDKLLDTYGTKVSLVILLNFGRGTNFKLFEESQQKQKALEMNANVMKLRKLHEGCMRKIDVLSISFWAAINNNTPKGTCLSVSERQRVKIWLNQAYQDLDILLNR
jgi:hypothetical protein